MWSLPRSRTGKTPSLELHSGALDSELPTVYKRGMNSTSAEETDLDVLPTETPRQRKFREDMEGQGIEVRTYSGRGMFGQRTYGVTCYQNGGRSGHAPSEQDVYGATKVRLTADSMGLGTILYVR